GVGLSLNNARAVLEALFNHKSDFTRTPKYGIERKSQPWRTCKYRPLKSALPLAELAFAIYFTYFLWFAIVHEQFISIPFLLMFQSGFLYVRSEEHTSELQSPYDLVCRLLLEK